MGRLLAACGVALVLALEAAAAPSLREGMRVALVTAEGQSVVIGRVNVRPSDGGYEFALELDGEGFTEKFLSMRPFRCLERLGSVICHLPYPYEKGRHVDDEDWRDLEYELLFLRKTPEEYGINAWNGLYCTLRPSSGGLDGALNEVDLNVLAAPPEDGVTHPVTVDMLHPADTAVHVFPTLEIR